jgi:hypothetical protein
MRTRLEYKTGWGRNEILTLLDEVLIEVAEQEINDASCAQTWSATAGPASAEMSDAVVAWEQDYFT